MPPLKPTSDIAAKWARVTPQRTEDYRNGVSNPRADWASSTAAADQQWRDGITAAAGRGAFAAGVRAAGTQKWQAKAIEKGPTRFAEGVSLGAGDYERGFAPFRETIERTTLPPRGPKGDPRNIERVRVMSAALRARKTGITPTRT